MSSKIAPLCNITSDLHRARILIVEDDPVMRLGLEQFFEGYPEFHQSDAISNLQSGDRYLPEALGDGQYL